jgi:hypothetical protein
MGSPGENGDQRPAAAAAARRRYVNVGPGLHLQVRCGHRVYLHGAFAFRIEGVVAAAVDDSYFLFQ